MARQAQQVGAGTGEADVRHLLRRRDKAGDARAVHLAPRVGQRWRRG